MKNLSAFLQTSLSNGKYFFTKEEALAALSLTDEAFRFQAYRLKTKKRLRRLVKHFYMIIPSEYYHLGSVPIHWIIDPLMQHVKQDYYIGLLTAASMYGATHQQPMSFQVMTPKARRPILLDRGAIVFHQSKSYRDAVQKTIDSPTGPVRIATPEQTLLDILRFLSSCGYMHNVCLVIRDLMPSCTVARFEKTMVREKNTSILQRLGFILLFLGMHPFSALVEKALTHHTPQYIGLFPDLPLRPLQRDTVFKIIVNDTIELDT